MNSIRPSCRALNFQSITSPVLTQLPMRTFSTSTIFQAPRTASQGDRNARTKTKEKARRKKKHVMYKMPNLSELTQYALCDAMQYIKAFEVGHQPAIPKYDIHVRLKTKKDGPILRNQIRLPHSVKTDIRVCVICPPNSKAGKAAKDAGAALVGEEEIFDIVKNGKIDFDRCITTPESLPKIMKEGLARILGPRGLMPSVKLGTVTDNIAVSVQNMLGGSTYRERQGVIRMAIGQLGFSPEQLKDNVKAFLEQLRQEAGKLSETQGFQKDVFEVVLSSTNSPGFSLNGEFRTPDSMDTKQLAAA